LKKSYHKKHRLIFQKDELPRSLFKLSIRYCDDNQQKSKAVKKVTHTLFKSLRGFMGDIFHPYPLTLALEIVNIGRAEPLLRDEIFCQIIKQTSENPSEESALKGLKLMYLCFTHFTCGEKLAPFLLTHIAGTAHENLPTECGFNTIADVSTNTYFAFEVSTKRRWTTPPPDQPYITALAKGTLPPLRMNPNAMMPTAEEMKEKREEVKQREIREKKAQEKTVREKEMKTTQVEKDKANQMSNAEVANRQKQQQIARSGLNTPSSPSVTSSPNMRAAQAAHSPPHVSLDKK